jgi:hypothetical protein
MVFAPPGIITDDVYELLTVCNRRAHQHDQVVTFKEQPILRDSQEIQVGEIQMHNSKFI